MYLHRTLEPHIQAISRSFPVLLVTGPRQVGKTTLLRHLGDREDPPRRYVSLDEFGPQRLANEDPDLFLQRYRPPITIDEIQHAPGLFSRLKPAVDRTGRAGQYWLTGSQHFPLMRGVSESLAGRVGVVELMGLSTAEESGREPAPLPFRPDRATAGETDERGLLLPVFERILRGSFPRFVQPHPPPLETFHGSYLQTYIERDVLTMTRISNLAAFRTFLRLAAARVGGLVNYSNLARDAGIAVSTAREWMQLLEASYQVILLRPYLGKLGKRQIKTPKLYFSDTGVASHLCGWRTAETAASGAMAGALFENYIVSEVFRSYRHRGRIPPLWFYRTKDGKEVDLLIEEDGQLFPVEVKLTASPSSRHLAGIRTLRRTGAPIGASALVCLVPQPVPLDAHTEALPVSAIA